MTPRLQQGLPPGQHGYKGFGIFPDQSPSDYPQADL